MENYPQGEKNEIRRGLHTKKIRRSFPWIKMKGIKIELKKGNTNQPKKVKNKKNRKTVKNSMVLLYRGKPSRKNQYEACKSIRKFNFLSKLDTKNKKTISRSKKIITTMKNTKERNMRKRTYRVYQLQKYLIRVKEDSDSKAIYIANSRTLYNLEKDEVDNTRLIKDYCEDKIGRKIKSRHKNITADTKERDGIKRTRISKYRQYKIRKTHQLNDQSLVKTKIRN